MAGDVLHHDDGIIHDKTGRDGKRHQRKIVEAVTAEVHHGEGADQRYRHRNARNDRGPHVAQEEKYHQHNQNHGEDQRAFHVTDTGADRGRAVENVGDLDPVRNGRLQRRDGRLDRSTVSIIFAPGCRKMIMVTDGLPSM